MNGRDGDRNRSSLAERRVIRHFRNGEVVGASVKDRGWAGEAKYQALLAVAQAANSRRDLSSVLGAVAGALENLVPIDLIGVVTHEAAAVRARAIYFRRGPRTSGENPDAYVRRFSEAPVPRGTDGSIPPSCATRWSATARRWSSTTSGRTRVSPGPG